MNELLKHRRVLLPIGLLYLAQGIPIGLAMDATPTLLRHEGSSLHALSFLPLVGLPWVLKFLWAPWVDNHGHTRWGRRKSWIVPMQTLVLACVVLLALLGLSTATAGWAVALLALASLCSATQDIATDGLAAEYFDGAMLARVNAIQVAGVMVGFFVGGAGTLILAGHLGTHAALMLMTAVPLASLLGALSLPVLRPTGEGADKTSTATPAAEQPAVPTASLLRVVRHRPQAWPLLTLALLSAMTAVSGFGLAKLFLNDAGWSLAAIGQLGMSTGMVTIVFGCGGGAWLVRRLGLWPAFCLGIGLAILGALLWATQATGTGAVVPPAVAWCAALLGALSTGITSVAMLTAGMQFARSGRQAGTDATAIQSTRDLGELLASSLLVATTAHLGYRGGFATGAVLAACALMIAWRQARAQRPAGPGVPSGASNPASAISSARNESSRA
jgi:MFS transporter, PAT family, beta-lactamase induction signal transducer AmpG